MKNLFSPCVIGKMSLKNRFVRSATEDWLGMSDGRITTEKMALYEQLATGGVGTIITGHAYVAHPHGRAAQKQNGIWDDKYLEGWRELARIAHAHDTRLVLQLAHAGRQTSPEIIEGEMPVAPSDLFDEAGAQTARALSEAELQQLAQAYAAAARRAKEAGCDGVQLHMAHGYLLAQFLSPYTNRREDVYGGSWENRVRFPLEVVSSVRLAVGPNFPLWIKLNSTDGLSETMQPQLSQTEVVQYAKKFADASVDAIELSGGTIKENRLVMAKPGIRTPKDEAYFLAAAEAVKAAVEVPIILVGGMRSRAVMQEAVNEGKADLISMSRAFICEPDLVKRLAAGQEKASCISCNGCFNPQGIRCVLVDKNKP
jgi:2,4-dienoyl-CoA reductase-like NADH-dependent reductase (Old Yellow Enzyme family)